MATTSTSTTKSLETLQPPAQTPGVLPTPPAITSPQDIVTLVAGQSTTVKAKVGHYYKIRALPQVGESSELQTPDQLIATRKGDALHLRYADGSTVRFEDFYNICKDAIDCSVNVASDASTGMTLTSDMETRGVTTADGGRMVYAHGSTDGLMSMARGQTAMEKLFSAMGDAPTLTYLPDKYLTPLGAISEVDGIAILTAVSGAVALGAAVGGAGGGGAGAAAGPGTQTISAEVLAANARNSALTAIFKAAENNNASASAPLVTTYRDAGVTSVTASNVDAVNSALNTASLTGAAVNSVAKIQNVVDAYNAILAEANGVATDATPDANPTATQYAAIGASIGAAEGAPNNLALLNDIVAGQEPTGVDTVAEIDNLARIANAIALTAAGGTPATALTAVDFARIGVTGVNDGNLPVMLAAIAAKSDDGAQTRSLGQLQGLVDSTAPSAVVINPVAVDNTINAAEASAGFDFTGTGEAGAAVALTLSSGTTLAGTNRTLVGSDGNWHIHVSTADVAAFGEGAESVRAVQTDAWGNASPMVSRDFSVATMLPATPRLALATDTGTLSRDGVTSVATVNVTGLDAQAVWQYQVDGGAWNNGAGSSFNLTADSHTYAVHQTDAAGNTSAASSPVVYKLDTTAAAPQTVLATDSGRADGITNVAAVNLTGLETGATWQYQVDGGAWTDGTGSSFSLSNGRHTYAARQTDLAGNSSLAGTTSTYTLDTQTPDAPVLNLRTDSGISDDGISNDSTVNVARLEGDATWQYRVDSNAWQNGSGSSFTLANDGQSHTYVVQQTDLAGNTSIPSAARIFKLDTTGPTAQITYTTGATAGTFHLIFTFSENVVGFDLADVVTGGTLSGFAGSGSRYIADITFAGFGISGLDTRVNLRYESFDDLAANHNSVPTQAVMLA